MKSYFKNANIVDVINSKILEGKSLIIEDGEIKKILDKDEIIEGKFEEIIDLKSKYIMPGLIDCHVHVFSDGSGKINLFKENIDPVLATAVAINNLETLLKSGVTYIRDLGSARGFDISLKECVSLGIIKGPNIKCCGQFITMTGGHMNMIGREADGIEEVRKATRESIKMGADIIKLAASGGVITPRSDVNAYQFNEDELRVAVIEGHKANKKVATHAHSVQAIKNSILAGVDSIEHGSLIDDECIELMVKNKTYLVPTLKVGYSIVNGYENGEKIVGEEEYKKEKGMYKNHGKNLEKAYKAGVKIALGTDSGVPGCIFGTTYQELLLLQKCNVAVKDILKIATINSAELLDINDKYGVIAENKIADFLVLNENPFNKLETIGEILAVYKNGKLV
ncbi:amidohydrolase family protein [uncultured Clostridium sp.]|uniref:metal-dependent hydrolase family protein n=1 Tax=uncultured Clostridium sp. TaxID=59620 RepID=UPI0026386069|nr:amidohydrolase family protein [uncultured Clostridium sp.]